LTHPKRIFVSNRLPFSVDPKTGEVIRGTGGLVSALLGVNLDEPFVWMGFETDKEVVRQLREQKGSLLKTLSLHPVAIDKKIYDRYYDNFSNDVLWPLFHYESENTFFVREHWEAYKAANVKMAEEILKIAGPNDTVWIHDFHFLLLPALLKSKNPKLKVGLFLHVPFPTSEMFRQLPVRNEILKSMVSCDLLGFHEHSYLRHFTVAIKNRLGIDSTFYRAQIESHTLHLGVYPISIDGDELKSQANSKEVKDQEAKFYNTIQASFLVLGIDRLDYTKGLDLKLRGFYRLLHKYPEVRGKIKLLQVAIPTRTKVRSYIRLKKRVDQLVGMINGEFGQPGYNPVSYIFNSVSQRDLLALYRRAECLLVTSKRDGMNLVSMEYVVAKDLKNPGVLVLSEFAGAASILAGALIVNPWDEDSVADAIYQSYQMDSAERLDRMQTLQKILTKYSATQWAKSFLKDLENSTSEIAQDPVVTLSAKHQQWPEELLERIKNASKCYFVTDYDGTLVPLGDLPATAIISEEQKQRLRDLQKDFSVWVLSGRDKDFLSQQLGKESFHLAAEHGAYARGEKKKWVGRITSDISSWYGEIQRLMQDYAVKVPLSFVETKKASLVWHYRLSPEGFADYQAKKLDEELLVGFANQPVSITMGSKIVEAKAIECNKGHFLRELIGNDSDLDALYICIGDDRTDEDMFRLPDERKISIKIGPQETSAGYRLNSQSEVAGFLEQLLAVRGRRKK
jgi:trehalose 6-phosphate synthase/phosphatase